MHDRCPFGGVSRRRFLGASVAAVPLISAVPPLAAAQAGQATGNVTHHGGDVQDAEQAGRARALSRPGRRGAQPADVPDRHPRRRGDQDHARSAA